MKPIAVAFVDKGLAALLDTGSSGQLTLQRQEAVTLFVLEARHPRPPDPLARTGRDINLPERMPIQSALSGSFPAAGGGGLRLGAHTVLGEGVEDVLKEEVVLPAPGKPARLEAAVVGHGHHGADVEPKELGNLGGSEDGRVPAPDLLPPRVVFRGHSPSLLLSAYNYSS